MFRLIKRHLLVAAAFGIASNLALLTPTIYLLQVYDRVLPSRSLETLWMLMAFMAIALCIMLIVDVARSRLLSHLGMQLGNRLDRLALDARIDAQARQLPQQTIATPGDINTLRGFFTGAGVIAFLDAPWLVVYLIIIGLFHWSLCLIAAISGLLLFALALLNDRLTHRKIGPYLVLQRDSDSTYNQITRNAEVIAVLGMADNIVGAWDIRKRLFIDAQREVSDSGAFYRDLTKVMRQAVQVVMMAAGAWLVIGDFATPGVMLATTILLGKALAPVEQMIGSWKLAAELRQAWGRLDHLLSLSRPAGVVSLPPPTGDVVVEHVAFGVPSRVPGGSGRMLLRGIDFSLAAGELLVIVGPSASGESTLLRVIAGLWKPQSGVVRLDGADVALYPRTALGKYLGYVPQDVELFSGTVGENIARTAKPHPLDSDAIVRAARRAGVHDMVLALPNGYETQLGDSGEMLSGGQRQRISLARALYGDPKLVLLDEPNANLDGAGETALESVLAGLKADGVTVIAVTHRPSLVSLADRLMEMRDGQVVGFGRPQNEAAKILEVPSEVPPELLFPEHRSALKPADRQTAMDLAKVMS
jgi:ATP-binding cassette, subfamily C, bacterial EexD